MDTESYCTQAEREERLRKQRASQVRVDDDGSPLIALSDTDLPLVFEPSMIEDYEYRVREAVCPKIERICRRLQSRGHVLVIRSAWRSFRHQFRLWEKKAAVMRLHHPERNEEEIAEMVSRFIAPPRESMHATGGAVDALLYDTTTDRVLDFGNNEGLELELDERCYPRHPGIAPHARQNRQWLMDQFEEEGFVVDCLEYWHFDFGNVHWAAGKGLDVARYGIIEELEDEDGRFPN